MTAYESRNSEQLIHVGIPLQSSLESLKEQVTMTYAVGREDEDDTGKIVTTYMSRPDEQGNRASLRVCAILVPRTSDGSIDGSYRQLADFALRDHADADPQSYSLWWREDTELPGGDNTLYELRTHNTASEWSEHAVQRLLGLLTVRSQPDA